MAKRKSTKHTHQTKDRVTRTPLKFACHAVSHDYTDKYVYDYVKGNIRVDLKKKTIYTYIILIAQEENNK
jgi:hypothetical protein